MIANLRLILTIAVITGAIGLVGGFYVHVEGQGYRRAETHYLKLIKVQEDKNRAAVRHAQTLYVRQADELATRNREIQDALDRMAKDAALDPDAHGVGLNARSVQRLNQIR